MPRPPGDPVDPFSPPGGTGPSGPGGDPDGPLALARDPRRPPPANATLAPEPGDRAAATAQAAARRRPVAYKKPPGGIGNFVLWALAAVGLGAAVLFGARVLKRGAEGAPPTASSGAATVQAAPAPAKPVVWKAVQTGDAVLVTVEVVPRSARLLLDGEPLPSNPARLTRGSTHTFTAVADGFQPASVQVTADEPTTVRLKLKRQ